jgi:hypothetical protein
MKKAIKFLSLSFFLLSVSLISNAQVSATYGPEVGFTASGLYDSYNSEISAGVNVHFGGTAHIQVGDFFAVRPSVLFQTGTFKNPDYDGQSTHLSRISIPIALLFSKKFSSDNKLYVGFGPNIKYAITGKSNNNIDQIMRDIKFGSSSTDEMKRLDFGVHFRAGFDFARGASLGLFLNYGLTNLDPHGSPYTNKAIDAIGFSFAWMFGGSGSDD